MAKHRALIQKKQGSIDYQLLGITLLLSIFGICIVFDSSATLTADKFHYAIFQGLWVCLGLIGLFTASRIPYKLLTKWITLAMAIDILLLIIVLFTGHAQYGAVRWINIGPFQFQPSELTKPVYILFLAAFFSKEKPVYKTLQEKLKTEFWQELLPFLTITILTAGLVIVGKDLGTAIIITATGLTMYFLQGKDIVSLLYLGSSVGTMGLLALLAVIFEPYRLQRLLNFSGSGNNSLAGGYEIHQILIAIGSGGWTGEGFTQGIQKQQYLVQATAATDSIFAVIAEEMGFIGATLLIIVYVWLLLTCVRIATRVEDNLGKLIVLGITVWIILQALLNIAVNVNLVPLTGVPLPFISYGGSSTIILLTSIGIILNISRHTTDNEENK